MYILKIMHDTKCCLTPKGQLWQFSLLKKTNKHCLECKKNFKQIWKKKCFSSQLQCWESCRSWHLGKKYMPISRLCKGRVVFWNSLHVSETLKYFSTIVVLGCWFIMWFAQLHLPICTSGPHFKSVWKR